jgi:hypothetical protein
MSRVPGCRRRELTVEGDEFADVSANPYVLARGWWSVVVDEKTGISSMVGWRAGGRSENAIGGLGDRIL